MYIFANEQETLTHLSQQHFKWNRRTISFWTTTEGKSLDDSVLSDLAKQGYFVRIFHGAATYGEVTETITDKGIAAGFWGNFFQVLAQYAESQSLLLLSAKTPDTKAERRIKLKLLASAANNWKRDKPVTRIGTSGIIVAYPDGSAVLIQPIYEFINGKLTPVYTL